MSTELDTRVIDAEAVEVVTPEAAIAVMRKTALAGLSAVDVGIAKLRRTYKNKTFAVDTAEGMEAARKARLDLRERRYKVPHIVKAQKAAIKQVAEAIETEGERITNAILALETPIHNQIRAEEDRKTAIKEQKDREAREQQERVDAAIADIMARPADAAGKTAAEIAAVVAELEAVPVTLEAYGESAGRVDAVKAATLERLDAMHAAALAHEQEQAALAASRAALEAERRQQDEAARVQREQMEQQQREHDERMAAQRAELERMQREVQAQAEEVERKAREQREEQERQDREKREEQERTERDRQQRAADVQRRIDAITVLPSTHSQSSPAVIESVLRTVNDTPIDAAFFDDRVAEAEEARRSAVASLQELHAQAKERERLQAEQDEAARRAAAEAAAKAAALDAKRKHAPELYEALAALLCCPELAGPVSADTAALLTAAQAAIDVATATK